MTTDILLTVGQIVGLVVIGALLKWAQFLRQEHAALLNSLVINLTLPATVFLAVRGIRWTQWQSLLLVPLVAYLVIAGCGVVAYLLTRLLRLERRTAGIFIIIAILGSTASLGYPLVEGLFRPAQYPNQASYGNQEEYRAAVQLFCETHPKECASYDDASGAAAFYSELGTLLPMLTVAVVIASRYGEGERFSWRNLLAVLKFGPFVAFLIGLLFLNEEVPAFITGLLGVLRTATMPIIMLSLGITIRWGDFFGKQRWAILAVSGVKLLLAPLLALLFCSLLGLSGDIRLVTILESALPALILCLSYASQYRLDVEFASNALFASFFFGAITLPIVASLISH